MPTTLNQRSSAQRAIRHFLRHIRARNLFPYDAQHNAYVQCFSWGPAVTGADIDHARAFAEGLRHRYGDDLRVRQHLATVTFWPSKEVGAW